MVGWWRCSFDFSVRKRNRMGMIRQHCAIAYFRSSSLRWMGGFRCRLYAYAMMSDFALWASYDVVCSRNAYEKVIDFETCMFLCCALESVLFFKSLSACDPKVSLGTKNKANPSQNCESTNYQSFFSMYNQIHERIDGKNSATDYLKLNWHISYKRQTNWIGTIAFFGTLAPKSCPSTL